jgi:trigger factor
MNIQITSKKSSGVERLLEVSVPADDVRQAEESAAARYATRVRLPGFRPGKAPAAMVRKRFGDAIRQQALEALIQEAYKEAIEREQLKPATQPHVHDVKFEDGKPLTFELHLEVRPDVSLPRLGGFRVERPAHPVTDEHVNEQVEHMREQRAAWSPVTDKAAPGDMVTVLLATPDDSPGVDSSAMPAEGREYRLVLGEGQAIPGIEELIMEATPGQTVERSVRWPDDFPDEAQRGKTKPVRVELQDVKRKSLPALDDAFAREVGDFDSLAALRRTVREDLERAATRESDAEVRQKLVDEIAAANPFDVPPSWVTQLIDAYGQAYQIPDDDRVKFAAEFRPVAERQVRRDLIIDTIAEREKLAATEAELDDRVAEVATQRKASPSEVYASLQKAGRLREIERGITEEKVFGWLLAQNTVT